MIRFKMRILMIALLLLLPTGVQAGLDLTNQTEVRIDDLDLNQDGRIKRKEVAEYMFYYFDRDGNEVLTKGEYHRRRPIAVIPHEREDITLIDIDNDGRDDGTVYDTETFLAEAFIDYDPDEEGIKALEFIDVYFLRLDTNKSGAIELDEWQNAYEKHAVNKPDKPPKSADHRRYGQ